MADVVFLDSAEDRALLAGASCAFGVFDGVHRGHRFLIGEAVRTAAGEGGRAVALTFDVDPDELFHPDRLRKLLSNAERLDALAATGVDAVCVLRFDRAFAALAPLDFLERTFEGNLPAHIHVGRDIRFGSRASGDLATLRDWGAGNGVKVHGHDLLAAGGEPITATRIRLLLEAGREEEARALLEWLG